MENVPAKQETSKAVGAPIDMSEVVVPHIGHDDFLAAKILCLQSMSKKVKDRNNEAKEGEFRDTIENKLFGTIDKPFEFIPLHLISFWVIYDVTAGGQGKYLETMPLTKANEDLKREEVIGNQKIKRVKTYECYIILPEEIKANGRAFPYVLSFRISSIRAGKALLSQMYVRNKDLGKLPFANVCSLSMTSEANDKGSFYVQHVKPTRACSEAEFNEAARWYKLITSGQVRKDDTDIQEGDGIGEMDSTPSGQF